jgi:hypothetical protein
VELEFEFSGEIWFWKGPSPFHFVTVPREASDEIHDAAAMLTYGWGVIPVTVTIGRTTWTTSLFPKDELYVVPIKAAIRKAEHLELGDTVALHMTAGS